MRGWERDVWRGDREIEESLDRVEWIDERGGGGARWNPGEGGRVGIDRIRRRMTP